MVQQRQYEAAWDRVKQLRAQATSDGLHLGYGRWEQQTGGVALSARVIAAEEAEDWPAVVENADQFLSTQPTDHRSRAKVEQARTEAQATRSSR